MPKGKNRDVGRRQEDHRHSHDKRGHRSTKSSKPTKPTKPRQDICGGHDCGGGGQGCFYSTRNAIEALRIPQELIPRPEPVANSSDHALWMKEYAFWCDKTCGCQRGYFCREHGRWIAGSLLRNLAVNYRRLDKEEGSQCAALAELGIHPIRSMSPRPSIEQLHSSRTVLLDAEAGSSRQHSTFWTASDDYALSSHGSPISEEFGGWISQQGFDFAGDVSARHQYVEPNEFSGLETSSSPQTGQYGNYPACLADDPSPQAQSMELAIASLDDLEEFPYLSMEDGVQESIFDETHDNY